MVVIALGVAAAYVSKKFLPRLTEPPGKEIRIAETVHLGSRKMLHLLKVGNQRLLIGSTSESITMLGDVTEALSETASSPEENQMEAAFRPYGGAAK
jgi:flagellar biosynthetic protein FliO